MSGRHVPRIGERFGEVVIESLVSVGQRGRAWLCRCDCGGAIIRTSADLNRAQSIGRVLCCDKCRAELRGGRAEDARQFRALMFRERWDEHRDLYHPREIERMTREIREQVAEEIAPFMNPDEAPPFEVMPAYEERSSDSAEMTLQQIGDVLGVSRERVRGIEATALRKLRDALAPLLRARHETYEQNAPAVAQALARAKSPPEAKPVLGWDFFRRAT